MGKENKYTDKEYRSAIKSIASRKEDIWFSNSGYNHTNTVVKNILKTCREVNFMMNDLHDGFFNCEKLDKKLKSYIRGGLKIRLIVKEGLNNRLVKTIKEFSEIVPNQVKIKFVTFNMPFTVITGDERAFMFTKEEKMDSEKIGFNICSFNAEEKVKEINIKLEEAWQK